MKKSKIFLVSIIGVLLILSFLISGCAHDTTGRETTNGETTEEEASGKISKTYGFFRREGKEFVFYRMVEGSAKKTGLKVEVEKNPSAEGADENIYSAVSWASKQVAYLQKPAWPHRIFVADIKGGNVEEVVAATKPTPTHATIENSIRWSADGKSIIYSLTLDGECGEGEGKIATIITEVNVRTKEERELVEHSRGCSEDQTRTIMSAE